jgi:uncharacterized membrane protein
MAEIFELLFKYRLLLFERGTIEFRPFWPPYITWLLIAGAIAGSYLLYRRTAGVLSFSWRSGLSALRAAVFLILILMLLRPVLCVHSVIPQKNFVAVAYDLSKSMEIRDGAQAQSRLDIEQQFLRQRDNPLLEELAAKFKLRFFRFSNSAHRTEGFDRVSRHGNITDLEKTLSQVVGEMATAPIAGVVLVTDGADNHSTNLDSVAAQLRARNIPIYAVGIGSSDFSRDTEVVRVNAPRKVLKDTIVEAEVSIRSTGYPGRRANLLVFDQEKLLQSKEITLGSDGEVKTYKVNFSGKSAGSRIFKFRIEPFADELVLENNDQTILIRIADDQPRILYVEGEPRWEYGFLRRAVQQDKNIHLVTLLRQADGKFLRQGMETGSTDELEKGFPTEKPDLFRYKALILGSVEASFFTFDQLRMISDFVSLRGGGFLMLGGKSSFGQGGYVNTPVEDLLPVNLGSEGDRVAGFQDLEYRVHLTSYGFLHPITRLSLSDDLNRKRWESAPPLVGFNPTVGPKPGATVLAEGELFSDTAGQRPLILAFQRFGKGKSIALTTASTWRWRMGLEHTDNAHELFWRQMLRWLASDVPDPLSTETERDSYSLDDAAEIRAEIHDSSFMPLNNATVTARIKAPSGETSEMQLTWDVERDGIYSTSFKPEEEGIHEVVSEAFQGGKSLGIAKTSFRIADSTEEFHQATLNSSLLKRLSEETGGRYYTPDSSRTLPEDIAYTDTESSRLEEKDLWDMPSLFLLIVGLASAEWMLRKRKGLA